jgi:invasion protein IalB
MLRPICLAVMLLAAARVLTAPATAEGPKPSTYSAWMKACVKLQEQGASQICLTGSSGRSGEGGPVVAAALVEPVGKMQRTLRIMLPLGMSFFAAPRIILERTHGFGGTYVSCSITGCIADYETTVELIARLRKSQNLEITAVNAEGRSVYYALPLSGFTEASDKPPADPDAFNEGEKKTLADFKSMVIAGGAANEPGMDFNHLVYSAWTKTCSKTPGSSSRPVCLTGRDGRDVSGARAVAVVLIDPEGQPKKLLRLLLPIGVRLKPGVRFAVDQGPRLDATYQTCVAGGCLADHEATTELLGKLKTGQDLFVQGSNGRGQQISVSVPLSDFAKTYEGQAR